MKQPGIKSIGAGPRIAKSSLRISIHEFNLRKTPCVNGLATGNSEKERRHKKSMNEITQRKLVDSFQFSIFHTLHFNASNGDKILQLILCDAQNGRTHDQP